MIELILPLIVYDTYGLGASIGTIFVLSGVKAVMTVLIERLKK